ncbi:MAG: alpha/beta hydrolase [Bacillota bacterium]
MSFTRTDVEFISHGEKCVAWLYRPDTVEKPPLIIMAHGFGALRTFGLEPFAEKFVSQGIAVLMFDYRGFGNSDGYPRNLISPKKHIQDWHSAIAYARRIRWVNHSRIGLWGSSYSGGHVLCVAAKEPDIAAIVIQVPFVNGLSSSWNMKKVLGWGYIGRCTAAILRDLWRMITFRSPYYIAAYGKPGELAVLSTPDSYDGIMALIPPAVRDWDTTSPARLMLYLMTYFPNTRAGKVKCPALVIAGERDSLIPFEFVKKTVTKMPHAEFVSLPCGHFDPYVGDTFEVVSNHEAEFFKKHLGN